ncbi:MAG: B12-binding domain-containing radical SAM protein [Deltaproteobacteria bacterium]|nr:B12-binding domain-containing radical SAM protein [Deltaproteobacteria bacterium]
MSDVLMGQAYFLKFDPKLLADMRPYPPLGSLLAAAMVREAGFSVSFFDAMLAESELELAAKLDAERPRILVLFEDNFNYLSKMCLSRMRDAAIRMIGMARARSTTVIVGGSDASDEASTYLGAGASYVLLGEGEASLVDLLVALRAGEDVALIPGVARNLDGAIVSTQRRPVMKDLDALPMPAWDLADLSRYRRIWKRRHGRYSVNVATTRGCPYHCNWCAKPIWGQRYNVRSPGRVAEEVELLVRTYGAEHLWFADDILGLKPGWVARFAEELARRTVRVPFKALSRADLLLREGELDALRLAGAETIWMGAESGSQKVLDAMDKGTTVEQIREARHGLGRRGIRVGYFLQFGYPGETFEDVEATLRLVRETCPDEIGISVSYPLPGTRFYESVREELGAKRNWVDSDDLDMMYEGPFTSAFYRRLHRAVHREHRARLVTRELESVLAAPTKARPSHLRLAAGAVARWAKIPGDRMALRRLAARKHGIGPLRSRMTFDEARRPSEDSE